MKTARTDVCPHHPTVLAHQAQRANDIQLRIADMITAYAGSMYFVYVHAIMFAVWLLFLEASPWPRLTLIVSLEAIFLSTFVMIGQNRQASFQQAKADHDFQEEELELKTNTELTRAIHVLTTELHRRLVEEDDRWCRSRPARAGGGEPAGFQEPVTAAELWRGRAVRPHEPSSSTCPYAGST